MVMDSEAIIGVDVVMTSDEYGRDHYPLPDLGEDYHLKKMDCVYPTVGNCKEVDKDIDLNVYVVDTNHYYYSAKDFHFIIYLYSDLTFKEESYSTKWEDFRVSTGCTYYYIYSTYAEMFFGDKGKDRGSRTKVPGNEYGGDSKN